MKSNTQLKIIIGIASIVPLVYLFAYIMPFVVQQLKVYRNTSVSIDQVKTFIMWLLPFFLVTYGTMIFLMVHVFKNKQFEDKQKMFWAVCIFFLNIVSYPVYWYLYILKEGKRDPEKKNNGRTHSLVTILFFVPLCLFIFIIAMAFVFAIRDKNLVQSFIMIWAVFFDVTFFPILIYLIVKTVKNSGFSTGKKSLWIVLLLLLHMFVFPVYRLKYMKRGE